MLRDDDATDWYILIVYKLNINVTHSLKIIALRDLFMYHNNIEDRNVFWVNQEFMMLIC